MPWTLLQNIRSRKVEAKDGLFSSIPVNTISLPAAVIASGFSVVYGAEWLLLGAAKTLTEIEQFSWEIAPRFSIALLLATVILGFFCNPIGAYGAAALNTKWLKLHFLLALPLFLLNFTIFLYFFMAGNGRIISRRNSNGNANNGQVSINSFADDTQAKIVRFALEHNEIWQNIQNELNGGCCGLNIQSMYADKKFYILTGKGYKCWYDQQFSGELILSAMKQGVRDSMCYVLFLSKDIFPSPYIEGEVKMGVKLNKPMIFFHHPDTGTAGYWRFEDYISNAPEPLKPFFEEVESILLHRRHFFEEATTKVIEERLNHILFQLNKAIS